MATNQITIVLEDCEPIGGYYVFYRPVGNLDPHRAAGPFFTSPIIFTDILDPANQEYEGYIQSHCGGGIFGDPIPWETEGSPSVPGGSEPEPDECCDPVVLTATTETTIPDGSLPGSGSDPEVCCAPVVLSACIETIDESGSGSGSESESESGSGSGSESEPDIDGIMHEFTAPSYAIMALKDLTYWNTRYDMIANADTPFDEIVLFPDELMILLKGGTNAIISNVWEDFQEESLGLLGFWDNSGTITEAGGTFAFAVNLEVVEMFFTSIFANGVFAGCTNLLSVGATVGTSFGPVCFQDCPALVNISLPAAISIGNNCFQNSTALEDISLPSCTDLGGTTGDNNVFAGITGQTITLTIPTATATDGDVVTLQANNSVTLILV